jgi:hypothetical protein
MISKGGAMYSRTPPQRSPVWIAPKALQFNISLAAVIDSGRDQGGNVPIQAYDHTSDQAQEVKLIFERLNLAICNCAVRVVPTPPTTESA